MAAGAPKRLPDDFQGIEKGGTYWRYMKLSKADWADVFADIYRQCFGETAGVEAIIADAERRAEILSTYRKAERKAATTAKGR